MTGVDSLRWGCRCRVYSEPVLLVVGVLSPVIFAVAVWLTRAGMKRAAAALTGGLIATAINIAWDTIAWRLDWWRYTFSDDAIAPLSMYIPVAFVFGAAAGLVGWRIIRAMGWVGVAVFYSFFVGLGVIRDHIVAVRGDVFVFGPGVTPHVIDAIGYLTIALAVQLTMQMLAGSPRSDALRAA
jgi:hypothetical protein